MILNLMQCSLNKVHQHHKWLQQKSWILSPDCLVARDKHLTQYLLNTRKMEDAPKNEIPKSECPDIWIRDKTAVYCHHSSDDKWKRSVAGEGGNKKRFQYWTDSSGAILYFRALQGDSGRNFIDPSLQNNVLILGRFLQIQLSRWMCDQFTLHQ